MKLGKFIAWASVIVPVILILAKAIGLLPWTWGWTLFLAIGIPIGVFFALLSLAVYIIKKYPDGYWRD